MIGLIQISSIRRSSLSAAPSRLRPRNSHILRFTANLGQMNHSCICCCHSNNGLSSSTLIQCNNEYVHECDSEQHCRIAQPLHKSIHQKRPKTGNNNDYMKQKQSLLFSTLSNTPSLVENKFMLYPHHVILRCNSSVAPIHTKDNKTTHSPTTTTTSTSHKNINTEMIHRLKHIRNVGILAHVDAGKTTVTERMLALAGIIQRAGNVDDGNTITDFLPAERERGITIQSAAISFGWKWQNGVYYHTNTNPYTTIEEQEQGSSSNSTSTSINLDDSEIMVHLIDTPGHVDFSVEVNRSVAVLDGAVLIVDAVAGCQAQTETVWRAMTRPSMNNHHHQLHSQQQQQQQQQDNENTNNMNKSRQNQHDLHAHEPLPCIAFVNKMDKEGCNFGYALKTLKYKLPGANPIAIQIPLFQVGDHHSNPTSSSSSSNHDILQNIIAVSPNDLSINTTTNGHFVGIVDLIHMRAIIYPHVSNSDVADVELCIPSIINLNELNLENANTNIIDLVQVATQSRQDLISTLADVDSQMEELFLLEEIPTTTQLLQSLRRCTLKRSILPVLTGAALRGKGVEPLLDAVADLLPSPLDRMAPALIQYDDTTASSSSKSKKKNRNNQLSSIVGTKGKNSSTTDSNTCNDENNRKRITLGHPMHPSLLGLAFKVVHMKNRGGSGDGRVVFVRIYSGSISTRDTLKVISPFGMGDKPTNALSGSNITTSSTKNSLTTNKFENVRTERVGGMLELMGGRFNNLKDAIFRSGDVCALIGLKSVVTGDTILLASDPYMNPKSSNHKSKNKNTVAKNIHDDDDHKGEGDDFEDMDIEFNIGDVCLAGVSSPKPVLTVRIEAESSNQQSKLMEVLTLLVAEDPSLHVEETENATLLSGLGELHIEVIVDRLRREHGLAVWIGKPSVAYRESVQEVIETDGLVEYDRTIGVTRLQGSVHLRLEPMECPKDVTLGLSCMILSDPIVTIGPKVKEYLGFSFDSSELEMAQQSDVVHALISGCIGAMKRGSLNSYALANVRCHVVDIHAEGGLPALNSLPGSMRAASSFVVSSLLEESKVSCCILEPTMSIEASVPGDMVGTVLSDLTSRRGNIGDVIIGDDNVAHHSKALIRGEVPLTEILGYANILRSITGGEGSFSAEYKGHSPAPSNVNTSKPY